MGEVQMSLHMLALSLVAFGGVTAALPHSALAQEPTRRASDIVTVLGCVQKETEYRKGIDDGKGGTLGSGAGAGNEFVLRSARIASPDTLKPKPTSGRQFEEIYSVTGNLEREMTRAVGQYVAVSGYVEVAKSDGTDRMKDLPRLNALGWHIVSDGCHPDHMKKK
jgi:hypothetical protein